MFRYIIIIIIYEVPVEDNLNSARPKALGCNLPATDTENFHTFEPILVHFAPLNRREGMKESWVGKPVV